MRRVSAIRLVGRAFFCGLFFCAQVFASEDRALFWKLSSEHSEVYLLGSIHFANSGFYPLRSEIEQAFDASDTLVVEVDITQVSPASIMTMDTMYPQGESIKDHVSQETYNELIKRF